jgi:MFS family permease
VSVTEGHTPAEGDALLLTVEPELLSQTTTDGADSPQSDKPSSRFGRLFQGITRNVFVLGLVSFFTDIASEMITPIRSIFLATVLLAPLPVIGLIEGIAESTSSLLKIISGWMADRNPNRKPLIVFGYGLASLVKPLLAFVVTWQAALAIIFAERIGKGVRTTPRDAVLADSTAPRHFGKAFGFHRSLDTMGAAVGPLITAAILLVVGQGEEGIRTVFLWTAVPGVAAVLVLVFFLRERVRVDAAQARLQAQQEVAHYASPSALGARFWMFTAIATLFALGNSSDAFLFLRAQSLGDALATIALVYFAYNAVYALLATPLGALSDRWGRLPILLSGYVVFGLVYAGWAVATQSWNSWLLFMLYGVYTAATDGVARAYVSDLAPQQSRGLALGWFNGLTGFAALPANILAGWLWTTFGAPAAFQYGAFIAALSVALLIAWLPWLRRGYPGQGQAGSAS